MNRRKLEITEELRDLGFYSMADSLDNDRPRHEDYRFYSADLAKARRESTEEELPETVYIRAGELLDEWFSIKPVNVMERRVVKITKNQLKRIIREVISESSGTRAPYDSFGDVVGGRYNSRGRMVPAGGSVIPVSVEPAWDFITSMGAPRVSPSFWEDGKLMRFTPKELEALLNTILGLSGPGYRQWQAGEVAADRFIEELEDLVQVARERPEYFGEEY